MLQIVPNTSPVAATCTTTMASPESSQTSPETDKSLSRSGLCTETTVGSHISTTQPSTEATSSGQPTITLSGLDSSLPNCEPSPGSQPAMVWQQRLTPDVSKDTVTNGMRQFALCLSLVFSHHKC